MTICVSTFISFSLIPYYKKNTSAMRTNQTISKSVNKTKHTLTNFCSLFVITGKFTRNLLPW